MNRGYDATGSRRREQEDEMTKRGAGVGFCAIAAFLFAVRYPVAAIFGQSTNPNKSEELFASYLAYIGSTPLILSGVALALGVVYLVWAEMDKTHPG